MAKDGNRDQTLDIAKGLGILCVYLGHSIWCCGIIGNAIYSFHMPLFFLISGLLFAPLAVDDCQLDNFPLFAVFLIYLESLHKRETLCDHGGESGYEDCRADFEGRVAYGL